MSQRLSSFFFKILQSILFIEETNRERKRESSLNHVYSPNAHSPRAWPGQSQEPIQVSHVSGRDPILEPSPLKESNPGSAPRMHVSPHCLTTRKTPTAGCFILFKFSLPFKNLIGLSQKNCLQAQKLFLNSAIQVLNCFHFLH